ncbi:hypothetical protein ACOMHN_063982 [Nucella lapillus]
MATFSFLTLLGLFTFCVYCVSLSQVTGDATAVTLQSRDDVIDHDNDVTDTDDFAHRLRVSLNQQLRSLTNFISCLSGCVKTHADRDHLGESVTGYVRYFCNRSCMLMVEQHHVLPVTTTDKEQTSTTPDTNYLPPVG